MLNKVYSFFKFCETKRFNLLTIMAKIMYNTFRRKTIYHKGMGETMLRLIDVEKIYTTKAGDTAALNKVNLDLPETGMVFITGKSGSGKTTMLNVIGGLDGLTSGEVMIYGKKFSEMSSKEYDSYRNTFVGFIFQEYNLLPEYTVEKNINLANELQGNSISSEDIDELLKLVGIEGHGSRLPSELSGGQKQRVAIARALVKNPKIIMADEPTGALDSATGIQVMETLKTLSESKLIIVVSHDLELAERYADRIIRLKDGQVVEDVELSEKEIVGNVFDGDQFCIKSGAELNQSETTQLLKAIREKREITLTEKISVREKTPTDQSKIKRQDNVDVEMIDSKMKFKSAAGFGVKSLKVKPWRLVFTILLSVIAFSVFGIFDTVASYSESKMIANTLKKSDFDSVAAVGTYFVNEENSYDVKISQGEIDKINKSTGYDFRGVYELVDYHSSNLNSDQAIVGAAQLNLGGKYYSHTVNGFIEFGTDDFNGDTIKGFDYKVIHGTYPKYDLSVDLFEKDMNAVGITTYTVQSIVKRNGNGQYPFEFNGKKIEKMEDFIGATFQLDGSNFKDGFRIACIIDVGEVPEKYAPLKDKLSGVDFDLEQDFTTYINSGAQTCLFVGDGFVDYYRAIKKRPIRYLSSRECQYRIEAGSVNTSIRDFYKDSQFNETVSDQTYGKSGIFYVDGSNNPRPLEKGEVLVEISKLEGILLGRLNRVPETTKELFKAYCNGMNNVRNSQIERQRQFNNLIDLMKREVIKSDDINAVLGMIITQDYEDTLLQDKAKTFTIVGVYYGVEEDAYNSAYTPIVLCESDLDEMEIYTGQGIYSRIIAPTQSRGAKKVASLMTSKEGLTLNWFRNDMMDYINERSDWVQDFFKIFIYVAIVLALFSMFMLFNYISTTIVSKRQSIGVFRALGSNVKDVSIMFIVQSVIIAVVNAVLACIITSIACIFVNQYIMHQLNIPLNFAMFDIRQILLISLASVVTAVISSVLPIMKICQEKPVDLIRKL